VASKPVLVVTGSRKGIGRHLAEHYSRKGFDVFGCSREPAAFKLRNYTHFRLDVTDEHTVKSMFGAIRDKRGRVDVLLCNAGITSMNHSLLASANSVEDIMRTNVVGTFLFCREAAKLMKKRSFGRIVNFTSTSVPLKIPGEMAYAASKAAVITMTQILAREFAEFGITVNAVGPGPVDTDFIRDVAKSKLAGVLSLQAINRLGTFEDITNAVDFFIRPESDFITGQTLFLGGV
jgi:3-oxoacyl-[acyl-carrier protein] reductase